MDKKNIEDIYPLSPMQEGILFHSLYDTDSGVYITQFACKIKGIQVEPFKQSWQHILNRHPILRSAFVWEGVKKPVQVVGRHVSLPFELHDWRSLSLKEHNQKLDAFLSDDRKTGFKISRSPLLRLTLFQTQGDEYEMVWTHHHLLLDGWSMQLIFKEAMRLYTGLVEGALPQINQPRSYKDYIVWITQQDGASRERFWRQKLQGFSVPTALGPEHTKLITEESRGYDQLQITFSPDEGKTIEAFARSHQVTINTIIQAAWAVLLARYNRVDDVLFGVTVSGRPPDISGVEEMIGLFINTLPFRTRVPFEDNVIAWLKSLQADFAEASQYLHSSLVDVHGWSEVPRAKPLFESMLVFENYPIDHTLQKAAPGIIIENVRILERADFPLIISAIPGHGLTLQADFDCDRFASESIARMLGHLRTVIESIYTNPHQKVSDLMYVTDREQTVLLEKWNRTETPFPEDFLLHNLFEKQAAATPSASAIFFGSESLTYEELNERSSKLALFLQREGVGVETTVAICVNRSPDLVVGILGILKSGGAYVPIDPSYPEERIAFMVKDSDASLMLTQSDLKDIATTPLSKTICIDQDWEKIEANGVGKNISTIDPLNAAYVIYTSGSTGSPKGSVVTHQSLVNFTLAVADNLQIGQGDRFLQFASIGFDVLAEELFPALSRGATVVLREQDDLVSLESLLQIIEQDAITCIELPTAYWQQMVSYLEESQKPLPDSLRLAIVGGERIIPERLKAWDRFGVPLVHVYGLTETAVTTTMYFHMPGSRNGESSPAFPIGRPIANNQIYLLDTDLRPVPIGIPGELYIGGSGLGRCYLNRSDLTAERFIPNPFSHSTGSRLYKTGDLARYLPDGNVEFIGRRDNQVKIRGFRVEMEEIEAILKKHAGIEQAVLLLREDNPEDYKLVAYITTDRNSNTADREYGFGKTDRAELWPSQGDYHIYDEVLYHAMTSDQIRNKSYKNAIDHLVRDKIVVDVGTGADATLARICVEAGARKVYAIEVLEESYQKAKLLIERLGLEDKIIPVLGEALTVRLPEKADVCVSELIGTVGSAEGCVVILNDARRLLKEGGQMIPERCVTKIAAVALPDEIAQDPRFTEVSGYYVEKVFEKIGYKFDLRLCIRNFPKSHLMSSTGVFEDLNFNHFIEPEFEHKTTLLIEKEGRIDGFLLWVNIHTMSDDIVDVLDYQGCFSPVYYPVFDHGIEVRTGDVINMICSSSLSASGVKPDYKIEGQVMRKSGEVTHFSYESLYEEKSFCESPFYEKLFLDGKVQIDGSPKTDLSIRDVRNFLSRYLPDHMIPSSFVVMDSLPLTPNGKIARDKLPSPDGIAPILETPFIAPRNEIEKEIAAIWSTVLGIERIGINDNFFELGGHSLLATQVLSRLRRAFDIDLPLRSLFLSPTIAELCVHIVQAQAQQVGIEDLKQMMAELKGV